MSDLVKRLRIKAGMIEMGELIAWGSDVALMREAADALEMAAPAVQGEPLGYVVPRMAARLGKGELCGISVLDQPEDGHTLPVYLTPQPAEQQPDASGLVVTLKSIEEWVMRYADPKHPVATVARKALADYRKQGGEA